MTGSTAVMEANTRRARPSRMQQTTNLALKDGDHRTIFWPSKDGKSRSYRGNWLNDKRHGFGVQIYKGGQLRYEGEWRDDFRDGEGVLWVTEGSKTRKDYVGFWQKDVRTGEGMTVFPNGEEYKGQWMHNLPHGQGTMRFADECEYTGSWCQGERTGYGHLTKPNGDRYEGFWMRNLREGSGSYFYAKTGKVFVGEWGNDQPIAGRFQQAVKHSEEPGSLPVTTVLPPLGLEDGEGFLKETIGDIRNLRLPKRITQTPLEMLFSEDDLHVLQQLYRDTLKSRPVPTIKDYIAMLEQLQILVEPALVQELLQLYLRSDEEAHLEPYCFETFAKLSAILAEERAEETEASASPNKVPSNTMLESFRAVAEPVVEES